MPAAAHPPDPVTSDPAAPAPNAPPAPRRRANGRYAPGAAGERFPVVALGGSAGALDALERFFGQLPATCGLALVVVMHRLPDPRADQAQQLAQVLQRFTPLPVVEAQDGLRVRPNHVYLIPPGCDLSLLHGCLYLLAPTQPPGRRLPIDFFLQTLAKDAGERAVCIILSGLGADGSLGLKLIMENFGMVMVQDPATAAYDAMPRAALATEFVDFVLPPEQLPAQLLDYVEHQLDGRPARLPTTPAAASASEPTHALQKILLLIRSQTGHDFSFYKCNTVFRRIERRMNAHQIKEFSHYVRFLQENPGEVEQLFHELLIGVTKFFRDPEAFASLQGHLRPLLALKQTDEPVRVWAPGCSTGEEAYSLAITLLECLAEVAPGRHLQVQIFATDIAVEGLAAARAGLYRANIEADVSPERLARYFQKIGGSYQIRKEVRDLVVFARHNLNKDAPFIRLDLLVCRNLLIYLNGDLQRSLLPMFHYALNPNGLLFLGPSENVTGFQELFEPLDVKWKISRRTSSASSVPLLARFPFARAAGPAGPAVAPVLATPAQRAGSGQLGALVQRLLLQAYAPPAVVIDGKGEILFVNGRTGRYLEPAPGLGGFNLFEMARAELSYELSGAVHRATQTRQPVVVDEVRLLGEAGEQRLRLTVRPLTEPAPLAGLLLVVFEDQPAPARPGPAPKAGAAGDAAAAQHAAEVAALDKELQYTRQRLQTTVEEMESSLEELKSTNEELQSANEELQSTNEEAMTNKEEMQSLNEELMTVNLQYQAKAEELNQTANDLKNLLDATDIAIIFLDDDLVVRRFTPPVGRIISLVPADVGRPLAHFASSLRYERLLRDAQQVLDRLVPLTTDIQTIQDEWFTMRILPYRSLDNYINGVVITFTNITALKTLEARLQENARFTESIQETVREPLLVLDGELRVLSANRAWAEVFGEAAPALLGQPLTSLGGGAWDQPALLAALRALLEDVPDAPHEFADLPLDLSLPSVGRRALRVYASRLHQQGQPAEKILLGVRVGS